ncbi:MAG: Holliday junction resolvase RuvX [Fusobacteriales bacterium]|nr:MAG: Holliday junction resolvase RuvX [Fusobacteriales bacterium]
MKRYIALDIGDVRIGVAKSDIMGIIAMPLETINRKKIKSVKRIAQICRENDTTSIVVGIPKSLDGTEKRQAEKVRIYVEKLKKEIENLQVIEVDERYSTVSADSILNDLNKKGAIKKRKLVDKVAASIILQTFLDMNSKRSI